MKGLKKISLLILWATAVLVITNPEKPAYPATTKKRPVKKSIKKSPPFVTPEGLPERLSVSPDKKMVAHLRQGTIGILTFEGKRVGNLFSGVFLGPDTNAQAGKPDVYIAAFWSTDGAVLVAGTDNQTVEYWDTKSWNKPSSVTVKDAKSFAFDPNTKTTAIAGYDKTLLAQITFIFFEKDHMAIVRKNVEFPVMAMEFSRDGAILVSMHVADKVKVWDIQALKKELNLSKPPEF